VNGRRRWKLQFDVRAATQTDTVAHTGAAERAGFVDEDAAQRCSELIRRAFLPGKEMIPPEGLAKLLEQELAIQRLDWPPSLLRRIWEELMAVEEGRLRGVSHEARWLNLVGFACDQASDSPLMIGESPKPGRFSERKSITTTTNSVEPSGGFSGGALPVGWWLDNSASSLNRFSPLCGHGSARIKPRKHGAVPKRPPAPSSSSVRTKHRRSGVCLAHWSC
jgi:hypothetical protein